ncbi:MAG: hypothetical protein ACFFDF_09035 [Candidatus Odinarchaeota archaeon]
MKSLLDKIIIEVKSEELILKDIKRFKAQFKGKNKLIYASIYRLSKINSYFKRYFLNSNIEIGLITTIPERSGLGGSAAIIIAILYGLSQYFDLYNNYSKLEENEFPLNKDIIAEIATKVEDEDLKVTAGYSDRYVISRGGLGFCSYYGKLHHKDISKEPLAIYDKIDDVYDLENIPIIVCYTGVYHNSGDIHRKLRNIYLQKNPIFLNSYEKLAEIAWKSRFAIMRRDWSELGKYLKENTKIMNLIMKEAGFKHGIGLANNILIELVEEHPEVYAAKLTGAGGGGSVFALVNPNEIKTVLNYWQDRLNEIITNEETFNSKFKQYSIEIANKLKNAQFFIVKVDKTGVKKL